MSVSSDASPERRFKDAAQDAGEAASFHEHGSFVAIWILVFIVGTKTMTAMGSILEPLLWAFFFMMALSPLVDFFEWGLLRLTAKTCKCFTCCPCAKRSRKTLKAEAALIERQLAGALEDLDGEGSDEEPRATWGEGCGLQRMVAVLVVLLLFVTGICGFFVMIYNSALHMQASWSFYEVGGKNFVERLSALKNKAPEIVVEKITRHALIQLEEIMGFLAGSFMDWLTSTLVEGVMMALYLVFWLCQPVQIGEKVAGVFKRYIILKTSASALYASAVYILLKAMQTDLAVVFALMTFLCNFVPEFGPFFAMLLPLPVLLFDGRLERPVMSVMVALGGQLALKFLFGNIVEVKLVEKEKVMRMHPVTILFFVAYFGWIWGATGMLLAVPTVAGAKATVTVLPRIYRDPVLIFLEGDTKAPARFQRMISEEKRNEASQ